MLSKEYFRLLIIATVVMLPLFYFGIHYWLNGFASQMEISVLLFIVPVFVVGIVAILTVSYQSYKTANLNPVDSIKYE